VGDTAAACLAFRRPAKHTHSACTILMRFEETRAALQKPSLLLLLRCVLRKKKKRTRIINIFFFFVEGICNTKCDVLIF
jgi:hypothetical protein